MFPQIFGKYVLEREIAAGGMARVYLATLRGAVGFEKKLVVKQIRPELASEGAFVRRFVDEAKTAVELSHPNIVPVYELGVEQGVYYLAMEFCVGVTLAEILNESGPLSPVEGAYVGIEICRALDYAHRKSGIVHRDVTPRNVMLDEEGAVRLIDFGIAAPATVTKRRTDLFGSPGHMPPEQIEGGELTPATDVFAVAVLLAEAWTGDAPFRRSTPEECLAAMDTPPKAIDAEEPELAPVAELVARAMSLDARERPESAEAFARPLRDFVKQADLGDVARRLGERVRRARRRLLASSPALEDVTAEPGSTAKLETPAVTRTFAARGEMTEWTRKLPSVPPPSDEPTPTTASNGTAPSGRSSGGWRLIAVLLAGVVIAGVITVRFRGSTPPAPAASSAPSAVPVAPDPTPAPTPKPVPTPSALPSASAAPVPKPHTMPSATAMEPAGKARLNLSAKPGARVSVDGRGRGMTPVMGLELSAGPHSVVFESPLLGERVSASVTLSTGQTRTVVADFTGSTAKVYVR